MEGRHASGFAPGQSFVWKAPKFRSQRNLGGMGPNFAEFRSNRAQISRNKVVKIANETLAWGNAHVDDGGLFDGDARALAEQVLGLLEAVSPCP